MAVKVLKLLLNGCQFLSEKVLLLLLGEGFVDDRGDLVTDFGDGREFDKELGNSFEPGFSVGGGEDFYATVDQWRVVSTREGLTEFVIELRVDCGGHGVGQPDDPGTVDPLDKVHHPGPVVLPGTGP